MTFHPGWGFRRRVKTANFDQTHICKCFLIGWLDVQIFEESDRSRKVLEKNVLLEKNVMDGKHRRSSQFNTVTEEELKGGKKRLKIHVYAQNSGFSALKSAVRPTSFFFLLHQAK